MVIELYVFRVGCTERASETSVDVDDNFAIVVSNNELDLSILVKGHTTHPES